MYEVNKGVVIVKIKDKTTIEINCIVFLLIEHDVSFTMIYRKVPCTEIINVKDMNILVIDVGF